MKAMGFDIGSLSVKGVSLSHGWFGTSLIDAREVPIGPSGAEAALRECKKQLGGSAGKTVISLDRRYLATRMVELPTRDIDKIRKLAPFQLEGKIPFANEALIDGCPVANAGEKASWSILTAIREQDFQERMDMAQRALGEKPSYHVDGLAALNVLLLYGDLSNGTEAFLDVGSEKTSITILAEKRVIATRLLLVGLKEFSLGPEADMAATTVADGLAAELRRSLLSCGKDGVNLARIVVTGGGGASASLMSRLSQTFSCAVVPLQPPLLKSMPTKFVTALGLAISTFAKLPIPLDFQHHERPHYLLNASNLLLVVGLLIVLALYNAGGIYLEAQALSSSAAELDVHLTKLKGEIAKGPVGLSTKGNPKIALDLIKRRIELLERNVISPTRTFLEVSRAMGNEPITLQSFIVQPDYVQIEGETDSFSTSDRLKRSLSDNQYFSDIKYERVVNVGPVSRRKLRFQLRFKRRAHSGG